MFTNTSKQFAYIINEMLSKDNHHRAMLDLVIHLVVLLLVFIVFHFFLINYDNTTNFLSTFNMPSTLLGVFHVPSHGVLTAPLCGKYYRYPHFTY